MLASAARAPSLVLANVEAVDTESGAWLPRQDIVIERGRIAAGVSAGVPAHVVDGSHLTALPGFVDAHFHCSYAGHLGIAQLEDGAPRDAVVQRALKNAGTAITHGVTSALDVGSHGAAAVDVRDAVARGDLHGPTMRVSGQIIVKAGGPMDHWELGAPTDRLFRVVASRLELERVIEEQSVLGVDAVKLQISPSAVQTDDPPASCDFEQEELAAAARTAHDRGLLLIVHAEGDIAILEAMHAGVDIVQHSTFADPATLRALASSETAIVFTLGVYRAIIRNGEGVRYPPEAMARTKRHWNRIVRTVKDAVDLGIAFGVGSDCGGRVHPHGDYLMEVVSLVEDVGLTPARAIAAATRGSARAIGHRDVGEIRPGAVADVVLIPSELLHRDIKNVLDAHNLTVVKAGEVVTAARD